MDATENMLEGDEPFVKQIANDLGEWAAQQFVDQFNNGCLHMSGFEEILQTLDDTKCFYAPLYSLSTAYDH